MDWKVCFTRCGIGNDATPAFLLAYIISVYTLSIAPPQPALLCSRPENTTILPLSDWNLPLRIDISLGSIYPSDCCIPCIYSLRFVHCRAFGTPSAYRSHSLVRAGQRSTRHHSAVEDFPPRDGSTHLHGLAVAPQSVRRSGCCAGPTAAEPARKSGSSARVPAHPVALRCVGLCLGRRPVRLRGPATARAVVAVRAREVRRPRPR